MKQPQCATEQHVAVIGLFPIRALETVQHFMLLSKNIEDATYFPDTSETYQTAPLHHEGASKPTVFHCIQEEGDLWRGLEDIIIPQASKVFVRLPSYPRRFKEQLDALERLNILINISGLPCLYSVVLPEDRILFSKALNIPVEDNLPVYIDSKPSTIKEILATLLKI